MSSSTLKAIPTIYRGVKYRSRLEARWAVFFDSLGIEHLFEYEGYRLPSGYYLPDFYLPGICYGTFVEIKPFLPSEDEQVLCSELAAHTRKFVILQHGVIKSHDELEGRVNCGILFEMRGLQFREQIVWDQCYRCGKVRFGFIHDRGLCGACWDIEPTPDEIRNRTWYDDSEVKKAFIEAQKFKFW